MINRDLQFRDQSRLYFNADDQVGFSSSQTSGGNELGVNRDYYIQESACENESPTLEFLNQSGLEINLENETAATNLYLEDGFVSFEDQSIMHLHRGADVVVEEDGHLSFADQSQLIMDGETTLTIESEGLLELNGDITVNLSENAQIIVEDDAEIVLGGGVTIQLNDPNLMDVITQLYVEGKLRLDGDVNLEGEGRVYLKDFFIEWDSNESWWEGTAADQIFLVVDGAPFEVPDDHRISLETMGVELVNSGYFDVDEGGIRAFQTEFSSPDQSDGIAVLNGGPIFIAESYFNDLGTAVLVDDFDYTHAAPFKTFHDLEFEDNTVGLHFRNQSSKFFLDEIDAYSNSESGTGIILESSRGFTFSECLFKDLSKGMEISKSKYNVLRACVIEDCDVGVEGSSSGGSNLVLRNWTEIKDNSTGVELYGHRYTDGNGNLQSSGLLMMDCARLWNNETGIEGEDILFMIDPEHIANSKGSQTKRPNEFSSEASTDEIFDVAYYDRGASLVQALFARWNYWGNWTPPDQSPGIPRTIVRYPGAVQVPLLYGNYQSNSLGDCPLSSILGPPTVDAPVEMDDSYDDDGLWGVGSNSDLYTTNNNGSDSVHLVRVFDIGMQYFLLDSFGLAEDFMTYLVQELPYGQDSLVNHLIQIAEIFSDENGGAALVSQVNTVKNNDLEVFPNPAWDRLNIQSNLPIKNIQVFNGKGTLVVERIFDAGSERIRIPVHSWPDGQYILRVQTAEGDWMHHQMMKISK